MCSTDTVMREELPWAGKGLLNAPGQNNCFLNSAVQVLWHVDVFRRSFRELTTHACLAEACIFCALKDLFTQLQFSQEAAPAPDALRGALARTFCDRSRFQLGLMDDAAECFETILLRIHCHLAAGEAEETCSAKQCIPHRKFAMTLVEQSVCTSCGATSEPLPFTQMVHYVSASALTATARRGDADARCFGRLLRLAAAYGELRECPGGCGAAVSPRRALTSTPDVISVGVVWDSERPPPESIAAVLSSVGTCLRARDLFHAVVDARWASSSSHSLVGLVAYYGRHYSTFFFHSRLKAWIYVDDASVREVGPRWEQVVDKCRRGRFQPLLLLYAEPGATPIEGTEKWNERQWRDMGYPLDPVVPDHLNNPGRRDSGNWSGDRNSASSSSSTTIENPYSFIPGGMQRLPGKCGVPKSPTSLRPGELSSSSSGPCDQGYDSYSLSSTDSLPLQQNLRHNLQLAQIPETAHPIGGWSGPDDCERLCLEADYLLEGSRRAEEAQSTGESLEAALALCRSAASKARAAMDAPYNNPHMLTVARMKHSACIMRARSLHRRLAAMNAAQSNGNGDEGSNRNWADTSETFYHSRSSVGSRRPRSRGEGDENSVRMYATLPRRKAVVSPTRSATVESQRLRSGSREKRARSEERKGIAVVVDVPGEMAMENTRSKKQHRIRRKLLGGPSRRRNGSMPDLHGGGGWGIGDSTTSLMSAVEGRSSGYLSEGHLEYNGGIERSRPTRRSFHGSMGRVPPPPPPRTTSRLCTKPPLSTFQDSSVSSMNYLMTSSEPQVSDRHSDAAQKMTSPHHHPSSPTHQLIMAYDEVDGPQRAMKVNDMKLCSGQLDKKVSSAEEDDDLPPYPSPPGSPPPSEVDEFPLPPPPLELVASLEDDDSKCSLENSFLDKIKRKRKQILGTQVDKNHEVTTSSSLNQSCLRKSPTQNVQVNHSKNQSIDRSLYSGCQNVSNVPKMNSHYEMRQEMSTLSTQESSNHSEYGSNSNGSIQCNMVWGKHTSPGNQRSVRDLASCFESMRVSQTEKRLSPGLPLQEESVDEPDGAPMEQTNSIELQSTWVNARTLEPMPSCAMKSGRDSILQMREEGAVESKSGMEVSGQSGDAKRPPRAKKSVTFCDRVVLVATAEDEDADCYVPNPILERVLRSALDMQMRQNSAAPTLSPPLMDLVHNGPWLSSSQTPTNNTVHHLEHDHVEYITSNASSSIPQNQMPCSPIPPSPAMMQQNQMSCSPIPPSPAMMSQNQMSCSPIPPSPAMMSQNQMSCSPIPPSSSIQNQMSSSSIGMTQNQMSCSPVFKDQQNQWRDKDLYSRPGDVVWNGQRSSKEHLLPPYRAPPNPSRHFVSAEESVNRTNYPSSSGNPCHLCRKKTVFPPAIYCPDCDFYMSRFRPKS